MHQFKKSPPLGQAYSVEFQDLQIVAICLIVIPLTWLLFLGWNPSLTISGQDGILFIPFFRDLLKAGGDWKKLLYVFEESGGQLSHDASGTFPIFGVFGLLGLNTITSLNLLGMFIQFCFGFLATQATFSLSKLWRNQITASPSNLSWITKVALVWIFSFAPILAWRINYGHWIIALGSLVFLSVFTMVIAIQAQAFTLTLAFISIITLMNAIPTGGQQTLVYSIFFGAPLVIGVMWPQEGEKWSFSQLKKFLLPISISVGSVAYALPSYIGLVTHATGSDSSRNLNSGYVTYSYLTATLSDWITSIPWTKEWIPVERTEGFWHEINYPFGPILLLLFLIPWKKNRAFAVGAFTSISMVLLFSMNIRPFSDLLLTFLPPLKSFRVPERAIFSFAFSILIYGMAGLIYRFHEIKRVGLEWVLFGFSFLLYFLNPSTRELILWPTVGILIFLLWKSKKWSQSLLVPQLLIFILGTGSLAAWRERTLPYQQFQQLITIPSMAKDLIYQMEPRLKNALNRAQVKLMVGPYFQNSPHAIEVSGISAYWFPLSRMLKFLSAIEGVEYHPTTMIINIDDSMANYPIYKQLYNIIDVLYLENGQIKIRSDGETAGAAWFSQNLSSVSTFEELSRELKSHVSDLRYFLAKQAYFVNTDPAIMKLESPLKVDDCKDAQVIQTEAAHGEQSVRIKVKSSGYCPLTVSMNYYRQLKAYSKDQNNSLTALTVFPVYGTLTGILVPPNTNEIELKAEPYIPFSSQIAGWLGFIVLLGSGFWTYYQSSIRKYKNEDKRIHSRRN